MHGYINIFKVPSPVLSAVYGMNITMQGLATKRPYIGMREIDTHRKQHNQGMN